MISAAVAAFSGRMLSLDVSGRMTAAAIAR
jgi:hypothetical protein